MLYGSMWVVGCGRGGRRSASPSCHSHSDPAAPKRTLHLCTKTVQPSGCLSDAYPRLRHHLVVFALLKSDTQPHAGKLHRKGIAVP